MTSACGGGSADAGGATNETLFSAGDEYDAFLRKEHKKSLLAVASLVQALYQYIFQLS